VCQLDNTFAQLQLQLVDCQQLAVTLVQETKQVVIGAEEDPVLEEVQTFDSADLVLAVQLLPLQRNQGSGQPGSRQDD
jgi:hypothetical protein